MILVYKVATTGLVQFKLSDDDPSQPHMVHVAAQLCTEDGQLVEEMNCLVRPTGWDIPQDSIAFHGISLSRAYNDGRPEYGVLDDLLALDAKARLRVAHNEPFDSKVVRLAMLRYPATAAGKTWEKAKGACSMKAGVELLKKTHRDTYFDRHTRIETVWEGLFKQGFPYTKRADDWVSAVHEIWFEIQRRASRGEAA